MGAIHDIFRRFAPAYLAHFGDTIPVQHRRVIEAICQCRTDAYDAVCYQCEACGQHHLVPAACGNRHCPQCHHRKARLWLGRQLERQVPGHHFMLTFTVPEPLRAFLRSHQKIGYGALFAASSAALKKRIADPRFVGGDLPGFFGVLHTWGRQLQYHPPIPFHHTATLVPPHSTAYGKLSRVSHAPYDRAPREKLLISKRTSLQCDNPVGLSNTTRTARVTADRRPTSEKNGAETPWHPFRCTPRGTG